MKVYSSTYTSSGFRVHLRSAADQQVHYRQNNEALQGMAFLSTGITFSGTYSYTWVENATIRE